MQIGVDAWNGRKEQVENFFRQRTGTTYMLLLEGGNVTRQYGFDRHNYAVIDHEGIVRYRSAGSISRRFDDQAIRFSIDGALEDLEDFLAQRQAEEEAQRQAEEEAQRQAEEEAQRQAEEEAAMMQAEEEAEQGILPDDMVDEGMGDMGMEELEGATAVGERGEEPGSFVLQANYPNPFNASTTIDFSVAQAGPARLQVFDLRGRQVGLLIDGWVAAGVHQVAWDGRDASGRRIASGVYFYQLQASGQVQTRKMVLVQ